MTTTQRWTIGIVVTVCCLLATGAASVSAYGLSAMLDNEHRVTKVETQMEATQAQLCRIETKLDQVETKLDTWLRYERLRYGAWSMDEHPEGNP